MTGQLAIISFWKRGPNELECYRQFCVQNPLFFPQDYFSGDSGSYELIFLHKGEKGEYFFFQLDELTKELYFSKVDFSKANTKNSRELITTHYGTDMYQLPCIIDKLRIEGLMEIELSKCFGIAIRDQLTSKKQKKPYLAAKI